MPGWRATNGASRSGGWSAYSPSTSTAGDQRLTTTNPAAIPAGVTEASMRFWHRYLLEPGEEGQCIDGGVLEISTNGGANWTDAGPFFTAGGYNGLIEGWQNPLAGRQGWCGSSVIFSQVVLDLSSFAGQNVLFRFRQGTDTFIAHDGWWIDDVSVSYTGACSTATITPVVTGTSVTTSVVPSGTPRTSTATRTPGAGTPTACTITFSDVPPDHTFYANIRCLACRGVLGGYSDGTFRPGNNITRGQIAKIVSNAAGFSEPATDQTFEDVPTNSTFYEWIERLSARGVMGGYPCGTRQGEPCNPPENRPYFRPNDNATRGQISKIVSNAAGFNDPVNGQFYADVLEDNPFYAEIMRLTNRGVMSGYPCGGPGEPCDDQDRPYFRWGNPVTRGQAAKIVANTFFPNCTP
jgi:hypothetical protein